MYSSRITHSSVSSTARPASAKVGASSAGSLGTLPGSWAMPVGMSGDSAAAPKNTAVQMAAMANTGQLAM